MRGVGGHNGLATGQVHVDPTGVFLGGILQAEFLADLFDARLDLLDVAGGVVALADDPGWVLDKEVHFLMRCNASTAGLHGMVKRWSKGDGPTYT